MLFVAVFYNLGDFSLVDFAGQILAELGISEASVLFLQAQLLLRTAVFDPNLRPASNSGQTSNP
jgi:hypothetical protein